MNEKSLVKLDSQLTFQTKNKILQSSSTEKVSATGDLKARAEKYPNFICNMVDFIRYFRNELNIRRNNFTIDYTILSTEVDEKFAEIKLYESVNFTYEGEVESSFVGTEYTVWLWNSGSDWKILDIYTNDWIEIIIKRMILISKKQKKFLMKINRFGKQKKFLWDLFHLSK